MNNIKTSTCSCRNCVEMCENRPCWPTPLESDAIVAAGLGHRLMDDYWVDDENGDIPIVGPAIVGYEQRSAPFWPTGRCTFLSKNGLCELHSLGLKPLEGRAMDHSSTHEDSVAVREHIVNLWRERKAQT